jgi:peptidoglycan/xylan/chitin deacetylase (PgdA/CDA1 family)
MTGAFLWGLPIAFMIYAIIPRIIVRILWRRRIKMRQAGNEVAFTFDDGPHPCYTPKLLDLLKEYDVKATFFIIGSQAERHPELIRRIHLEGHLIGIHNYHHHANWLLFPWQVRRQVNRSSDIVQEITGVRPAFYRPPWGMVTLFDMFLHTRFHIVLWTIMVQDWKRRTGKEKIKRQLLAGMTGGAVILLHDSGETFGADRDAPYQMLQALEEVFQLVHSQRFTCIRLDEFLAPRDRLSGKTAEAVSMPKVSWRKRLLVKAWMKWEKLFQRLFQVQAVDPSNRFLSVRIRTYQGRPLRLKDGEEIRKGDQVVELHLNNEMLFSLGIHARSAMQLALQMIRAVEQLLPMIGKMLVTHPHFQKVKGVYGITIIYRGTEQFGFTVLDLPKGLFSAATRLYLRMLLAVVHPEGRKRMRIRSKLLTPKIIAMSSKELIRRYQADSIASHAGNSV